MSYQLSKRDYLKLHFETTLPNEKRLVKAETSRRNYTTIYVGLTPELARKLGNLARKEGKTESEILRRILVMPILGILSGKACLTSH